MNIFLWKLTSLILFLPFPPLSVPPHNITQFRYYQADFVSYPNLCGTLWDCTKFEMNYGIQMGGGPADLMAQSNSARLWLDGVYFLVITVIWLNITFGIIIDTFSSLRSARDERLEKTANCCFICGITKNTFDRASDKPDGFKQVSIITSFPIELSFHRLSLTPYTKLIRNKKIPRPTAHQGRPQHVGVPALHLFHLGARQG